MDQLLLEKAAQVLDFCKSKGITLALAESCTGGLITAALTAIPGSSEVLDRGFVTYSNAAKAENLGVSQGTLQAYGAVSEATAKAMAQGALSHSHAEMAFSTTGIAGPGGSTPTKPVGLVYIGKAHAARQESQKLQLSGDRQAVRYQTVHQVFDWILRS